MKINRIKRLIEKHTKVEMGVWVVAFAWLAINICLYAAYGIQTELESKKYINEANRLHETGTLSEFRYHFYFGIIGVLYIVKLLGFGFKSAIGIQLIISLIAHIFLYTSLKEKTSKKKSIFALLLIIVAPSFEYWNWTLYSESIFFSAILFFIGACIKTKPTEFRIIAAQGLILILCIISRPSGILLAIPWILYVIQTNVRNWSWKIAAPYVIVGGIVLLAVSNAILGTIGDWNVMDPFTKGYVICNISEYSQDHQFLLNANSPVGQLIEFTIKYPAEFLALTFHKFLAFFTQYRNYYSLLHNGYVIIYSMITLGLFIRVLLYRNLKSPVIIMFYMTIALWSLSILFQCDDYHSRFYNAIIPCVVLCGLAIDNRTKTISKVHN